MSKTTDPSGREDRLAVNRREAAQMLGISERLLWSWTKSGAIPHARIGARVVYPVRQLREWLDRESARAAPPRDQ